jgi:hypothetical protein
MKTTNDGKASGLTAHILKRGTPSLTRVSEENETRWISSIMRFM